jgi:hypothetical protein
MAVPAVSRKWMPPLPLQPALAMQAADTNVVIRYLTGDDAAQAKRAEAFFATETIGILRTGRTKFCAVVGAAGIECKSSAVGGRRANERGALDPAISGVGAGSLCNK